MQLETICYFLFGIQEKPDNVTENAEGDNGAVGGKDESARGASNAKHYDRNENCVETVLNFCEQILKIENAKSRLNIELAYRLGKKRTDAHKARPLVVRFVNSTERDMVKNVSSRLKGSHYGISPHFPQEVLERRKQLLPIMFQKRKEKKKAFLVDDKLYVEGKLWEG